MFEIIGGGTYLKKYIPDFGEKTVVIPEGIITIAEGAFTDCKDLVCVKLSDSTADIWGGAFRNCPKLSMIVFNEGFRDLADCGDTPFFNCPELIALELPRSIRCAKLGDSDVRLVQMPDGVTELPQSIFMNSKNLETVILPESIKVIRSSAFMGCTNIQTLTLPSDLQEIEYMAFLNCERLRSLTIPSSVKKIGHSCFQGSGIEHVSFPEGIEVIGEDMFTMCKNLHSFDIPNSVTEIHQSAFFGTGLRNVRIPSKVKVVGENAFHCCEHLTDITLSSPNTKFVKHRSYSYAFPETTKIHSEGFRIPSANKNAKEFLVLVLLLCFRLWAALGIFIYIKYKYPKYSLKRWREIYNSEFLRPWYERVPIWDGELPEYLIDK